MKKLRVALSASVAQRGKSGVASYLFGLLEGLRAIDAPVEMTLLGLEEDRELFAPWLDWCRWEPVAEKWRPAARNIVWHQTLLRPLLKRLGAEVLHIPSYRRIVWKAPVPQVVTVHDCAAFAVRGKYDAARMFYGTRVVTRLARQVERLIAVSHATAKDMERHFKIPGSEICVIWNGIDHETFRPREEAGALLAERQREPYFLYLARLEHPGKNHVRLIEAFERFVTENPGRPEHLLLGGADWHGADVIHARMAASPCRERIRNLGFVEKAELPLWYSAAAAMIYPSLFEGFGLPPVEAMACGTPVICSRRGSLGEVVGDAARIIEPEDIGDMAAAMRETTPQTRARWKRAGLERAGRFDWKKAAAAVCAVYRSAAALPRSLSSP